MKSSFLSLAAITVVLAISSSVLAQEAAVAAPAPAAAPKLTMDDATLLALSQIHRNQLIAEAGAAIQDFHITQARFDNVEMRYEMLKLRVDNASLRNDLADLGKRVDGLEKKDAYGNISFSAGYLFPIAAGQSAPYAKVTLDKILGIYGEFVPGYGFGLGLNGFSRSIGRVQLDILGIGALVYNDSSKPMHSAQDPRGFDLRVKPLAVAVSVYRTKFMSIDIGGEISWLFDSPKAAIDKAEKTLGTIQDTTGNTTPTLPNIDPNNLSAVDPNTVQNQAQGIIQGQAENQVNEVKSKTEQALTEAGNIYSRAIQAPQGSFFLRIRM